MEGRSHTISARVYGRLWVLVKHKIFTLHNKNSRWKCTTGKSAGDVFSTTHHRGRKIEN